MKFKIFFSGLLILINCLSLFGVLFLKKNLLAPKIESYSSYTLLSKLTGILPVGEPFISDEKKIVVRTDNLIVIFSREKNMDFQVRALQELLAKFRMEDGNKTEIDLRFDKAVVRRI